MSQKQISEQGGDERSIFLTPFLVSTEYSSQKLEQCHAIRVTTVQNITNMQIITTQL